MKTKSWLVITLLTGTLLSLAFQFLLMMDRRLGVPLPYSVVIAFAGVMLMQTALLRLPGMLRIVRTARQRTVVDVSPISGLPVQVVYSDQVRSPKSVSVQVLGMTMVHLHTEPAEAKAQRMS